MHPAPRFAVPPVAEHDVVAAHAQLARLVQGDDLVVLIDNLDFGVRQNLADRTDAQVDRVVGRCLGRQRTRLGHAVADRDLAHVHLVDDLAHQLDRARCAGHDARAQRAQVKVGEAGFVEHGDEHRRHTVQCRAALVLQRLQGLARVEGRAREHDRRATRCAQQRAEHHREAVVHRHRDAQLVVLGEAQDRRRHRGIVDHVVMRQRRRLRCPGRSAGELDIDRRIEVGALSNGVERLQRLLAAELHDFIESPHAHDRLVTEVNQDLQIRHPVRVQGLHHLDVVAGFEAGFGNQAAAADLVERVLELGQAVGRVDVDEDQAGIGAAELRQQPFGAIGRQHADAIAGLESRREQAGGEFAGALAQLFPRPPNALVRNDQRVLIGPVGRGVVLSSTPLIVRPMRGGPPPPCA